MSACPRCRRNIPIINGRFLATHNVNRGGRERWDRCPGSRVTPDDAAAGITSVDRQVEDHYDRLAARHGRGLTVAERMDLAARGITR